MTSQFPIRILSGESPLDTSTLDVSPLLPSGYLGSEGGTIGQAPIQTLTIEDADFDLGHVEPAGMFGRVVKDDSAQQRPGSLEPEHLLEAAAKVNVQIVQNQMNASGTGIDVLDEMTCEGHEVGLSAPLGDDHGASATPGLDSDEQVAGAGANIFVVLPNRYARPQGQRPTAVLEQLFGLLVDTTTGSAAR
jgi:hypothetical protein